MKKQNPQTKPMSIYEAITFYYTPLMKIASREYSKIHGQKDDDLYKDIAHDTMLKLCDIFSNITVTELMVKNYYCKAVRMNYLRELVTAEHKNKNRLEHDNISLIECNDESKIDFAIIEDDIKNHFQEDDYKIFFLFYQGLTLRELNEQYHINNSAYKVRKIKDYIIKKYNGYELKKKTKKHLSK